MFMIDYRQINWWYWFATACVLTAGMAGYQIGFVLARGLLAVQLLHITRGERRSIAFTDYVRF